MNKSIATYITYLGAITSSALMPRKKCVLYLFLDVMYY